MSSLTSMYLFASRQAFTPSIIPHYFFLQLLPIQFFI